MSRRGPAQASARARPRGTKFMGAGFHFRAPSGRRLYVLRSEFPRRWELPGGHREAGETPVETARRETKEELSFVPKHRIMARRPTPAGKRGPFWTFEADVAEEFTPTLSEEHVAYAWMHPWEARGQTLHPKLAKSLRATGGSMGADSHQAPVDSVAAGEMSGMRTPEDLPEGYAIEVYEDLFDPDIYFVYTKDGNRRWKPKPYTEAGMPSGYVAITSAKIQNYGNCLDGYYVKVSDAASGWGPMLYDLAMEWATHHGGGLTADRSSVSKDAHAVWEYYDKNRPDIESAQLDILPHTPGGRGLRGPTLKQLTPDDPSDDCSQHASIMWAEHSAVSLADYNKGEWYDAPTSRLFRSKGNPTMEKLLDLGKLNLDGVKSVAPGSMGGVDDPGILKGVFTAGGPGSGKSYVAESLFAVDTDIKHASFGATGLKILSSDIAFEHLLHKAGIDPATLGTLPQAQYDQILKQFRPIAQRLRAKQKDLYTGGRLGLIYDGTGDNYAKVKARRQELQDLGYDTYMVFVETALPVAQERNANRARRLKREVVRQVWTSAQENKAKFRKLFGDNNFIIVENNEYKPVGKNIQKAINRFVRQPVQNPRGDAWIRDARTAKKRSVPGGSMGAQPDLFSMVSEEQGGPTLMTRPIPAGKMSATIPSSVQETISILEEKTNSIAKRVEASDRELVINFYRGSKMVGYFRVSDVSRMEIEDGPEDCKQAWKDLGEPTLWVVRGAEWFDKALIGKGLGALAYQALFDYVKSKNGVVGPDECAGESTSPAAKRVWERLRKKYRTKGPLIIPAGKMSARRDLSSLQLVWFEEEEEVQYEGDPHALAQSVGINILSNKEFRAGYAVEGILVAALFDSSQSGDEECYSFDVAVDAEWQGYGLGSKLIDLAIELYDELTEPFPNIQFCVDAVNPAVVRLLKRRGFVVSEEQGEHTLMTRAS